jgi:hypothetical protein
MPEMKFLKVARVSIVSCFVAAIAAELWFGSLLIHNRSTTANQEYDIPFAAHGSPVFISSWDWNLYYGLSYSKFLLIAIYGVAYLIGKNGRR